MDCSNCGCNEIRTLSTEYGDKLVCDECGHLIKDVDQYRGVMLWSHKTSPEIEIHANAESAGVISGSKRHSVSPGKVNVIHHAGELAGRRSNNVRASNDIISEVRSSKGQVENIAVIPKQNLFEMFLTPELHFQKCPGGKTYTSFPFLLLRKLDDLMKECFLQKYIPDDFIPRSLWELGYNDQQIICGIALRKRVSPLRTNCPLVIRVIEKDNKLFIPQLYK